jgi:NTE family protein
LSLGEVAGPKTLFNALVIYQQLARPSLLGFEMPIYLGASAESGGAWDHWDELSSHSMIWAGSLWFGTSTIIGPAFLSYGYANGGKDSVERARHGSHAVVLSLGRNF